MRLLHAGPVAAPIPAHSGWRNQLKSSSIDRATSEFVYLVYFQSFAISHQTSCFWGAGYAALAHEGRVNESASCCWVFLHTDRGQGPSLFRTPVHAFALRHHRQPGRSHARRQIDDAWIINRMRRPCRLTGVQDHTRGRPDAGRGRAGFPPMMRFWRHFAARACKTAWCAAEIKRQHSASRYIASGELIDDLRSSFIFRRTECPRMRAFRDRVSRRGPRRLNCHGAPRWFRCESGSGRANDDSAAPKAAARRGSCVFWAACLCWPGATRPGQAGIRCCEQ